jgi:DNA repair photolyase
MNIPNNTTAPTMISGDWDHPAVITTTDFKFKSLCEWVFNTATGCSHGCRFCYVPSTATNKQAKPLAALGVADPDADWGQYVFVRRWDEKKFMASLRAAEKRPKEELKPEGHRAVMFCSTTDPYQVIKNADAKKQKELNKQHRFLVQRALELIRDESTLNVRILTRSPLAEKDFQLMKSFGKRLLFGMSLPTLNNQLARLFEPFAPAPTKRMATLQAANDAGLNIYVALAPTYPNSDEADIRATLEAIKALEPLTVFHEPINIRAENVARIGEHAKVLGVDLDLRDFADTGAWLKYAYQQLTLVEGYPLKSDSVNDFISGPIRISSGKPRCKG